ncbi:MAG: hypothetical protein JNK64_29195, partial [Myxococcales bacterium]|nr:hypothetical protein [Myxococcales bacterium]
VTAAAVVVVPRVTSTRSAPPAVREVAPPRAAAPTPDRPAPAGGGGAAAPAPAAIEAAPLAVSLDDIELGPPPAPAPPRAPVRATPPPPTASPSTAPPPPEVASAPAPEVGAAAPAIDPLARELELLRTARTALRGGAAVDALAALAIYRREFADGQLAEEAAVLAVEAACAAGRTDELERLRAGFARRWPSSTAKAKVERMCR